MHSLSLIGISHVYNINIRVIYSRALIIVDTVFSSIDFLKIYRLLFVYVCILSHLYIDPHAPILYTLRNNQK